MEKASFAAFWHGSPMTPFELACIESFTKWGNEVVVYSYDKISALPKGVVNRDAREILSPEFLDKFKIAGKSSMAHYTDYFRYVMFTKTNHIWFDTDIILLREFDMDLKQPVIIGRETEDSICGAIMRLSKEDPRLQEVTKKCETFMDKTMKWGDTGPRLLTEVYGKDFVSSALPPKVFYPVHFADYYKVFLPEFREECEKLCKEAYTLHLWNNLVVKTGMWKKIGPPKGSFLHSVFEKFDSQQSFIDFYPETVMRTLIDNVMYKGGIKTLMRLIFPSIKNTVRRHA